MECKFGCHERENLQRSSANEHWTEAKSKSDSQVESLMNIAAEFKTNIAKKIKLFSLVHYFVIKLFL